MTDFEQVARTLILTKGSVKGRDYDMFWQNQSATSHLRKCGVQEYGDVRDDTFYEFSGTDAEPNKVQLLTLQGVTCNCGELSCVTMAYEAMGLGAMIQDLLSISEN